MSATLSSWGTASRSCHQLEPHPGSRESQTLLLGSVKGTGSQSLILSPCYREAHTQSPQQSLAQKTYSGAVSGLNGGLNQYKMWPLLVADTCLSVTLQTPAERMRLLVRARAFSAALMEATSVSLSTAPGTGTAMLPGLHWGPSMSQASRPLTS